MATFIVRVQTFRIPGDGLPWGNGAPTQVVVDAQDEAEARVEGASRMGVPTHDVEVISYIRGSGE